MKLATIDKPSAPGPSAAKAWLKAIELTARIEANPERLFADVVEDWAGRAADSPALISAETTLSYGALARRINRYARWALSIGLRRGETVGLMMPNGSDYLAAWLGISRVGGVVALINTRLVGRSLAHCVDLVRPVHVIASHQLVHEVESATSHFRSAPKVWVHGGARCERSIEPVLDQLADGALLPDERRDVTINDRALLIYTSGTTGLPKAASISHRRILNWGFWFAGLSDAVPSDRLYDCLPLFHSVGGIVAPCSMLAAGGSVVIAEKFSASQFWTDIVRHDCTIFQYIGELCRYLVKAPAFDGEDRHRLRLACGNGLRGDIWPEFQARFAVPRILEFYAATEGNFSLFNVEGKVGSIGRIPPLLAHRFPAGIIRLDESGTPLRDAQGLCIPCARGEAGEAVGRIGRADEGGGRFEGYTDRDETEKKILRNVLVQGDAWFRTGDLMKLDEKGFFYFVDRTGDTFRWKGENVATSEVNEAVRDCPGVIDASTYGVAIPGHDGKAGMSAIVVDDAFEAGTLARHLQQRLPPYAHPVFLRLSEQLDSTETFKQKKQLLAREGFYPEGITDPLLFRDPQTGSYRRLDPAGYAAIVSGEIRL